MAIKDKKQIELGQFFTPKKIVNLVYKLLEKNKIKYDYICDTSGGNGDFIKEHNENNFIYVDIDKKCFDYVNKNYKIFKSLNKNSLLDIERKDLCDNNKKLLIIGNPPYNNWTSFYQKNEKGNITCKKELEARDIGISFLKSYSMLKSDYVCILHPLSYLIKKSNFNQLKEFKDNYKLIDGLIISSQYFKNTSKNTQFPIIIALYKRSSEGMSYEKIKRWTFQVYENNYKFSLNQFLYIEDVHTKYKDKNITGSYKHFTTLRDMNQLAINKGFLEEENSQSIRVKGSTALKIFKYLECLKKWYQLNQNDFYFLGNLSPIVNKEIWKKLDKNYREDAIIKNIDTFIKKELTKPNFLLTIFGNKLIWNFTNVSPSGKYRFKKRENLFSEGKVKSSATTKINNNDFLEVQIGYDKTIDDFYNKPSIHKLGFENYKNIDKFIFELSDIFYWGLIENYIDKKFLHGLIKQVKEINNNFENSFKIYRKENKEKTNIIVPFNFKRIDVIKPSFVKEYVNNDFIEIKIDYKQKAVGQQAMLFLNLSSKNFTLNNEPIIDKTIKKNDVLKYVIDKEKYVGLFTHLVLVFANLSKEHNKDILRILISISNHFEEKNDE